MKIDADTGPLLVVPLLIVVVIAAIFALAPLVWSIHQWWIWWGSPW